jgi:hypothetical protein
MTKYKDILSTKIVKERIDEAMDKSKKSGKEHGFNICSTGQEITATKIIDGNRDSITMENTCQGVKIGSFHVHPVSGVAIPSPGDMENLEENGDEKFVCIGVNLDSLNGTRKIVKCFDNEDLIL